MFLFYIFVLNRVLDSASTEHRNKHSLGETVNQSGVSIPGWAGRVVHEYPISVLAALRERGHGSCFQARWYRHKTPLHRLNKSRRLFASTLFFSRWRVFFAEGRSLTLLFACVKMSVKAAVTGALQPNGNAAAPASEKSFVLKKIMDIPPPNILEEGDDGKTRTLCG